MYGTRSMIKIFSEEDFQSILERYLKDKDVEEGKTQVETEMLEGDWTLYKAEKKTKPFWTRKRLTDVETLGIKKEMYNFQHCQVFVKSFSPFVVVFTRGAYLQNLGMNVRTPKLNSLKDIDNIMLDNEISLVSYNQYFVKRHLARYPVR
ncbi:hypothetical protein DFS34DRAFT_683416 [Phlyctochytrium arcticum]|nr:hypothetical protein DFS34DRAFT_683416 [Phlyctochytrium arcticum]